MTQKRPYDFLVFIGRFQPFHRGHQRVIDRALTLADRVVVLIGSANRARSIRNPWTYEERLDLIGDHYQDAERERRLIIEPLDDYAYNETGWLARVQQTVDMIIARYPGNSAQVTLHGTADMRIGLIGAAKDHTSYYLKLFPNWCNEDVSFFEPIHATDIRTAFFMDHSVDLPREWASIETLRFLRDFARTPEYLALQRESAFVDRYKKQWASAPYPPIFATVDAVVVQAGHVLMVRRKDFPGQGQLALPGGFIGEKEKLLDAAIRELREETRLKVPLPVLLGSLKRREVFDDPERSSRGRTITNAFLFHLPDEKSLPKVKGGDDAASAGWHELGTIKPQDCYEDHYFILSAMTAGL